MSGARGVFVSLGFSLAPLPLAAMIVVFGWRGALFGLALMLVVFALVALLLLRDSPQSCGLRADGMDPDDSDSAASTDQSSSGPAATLQEARRSPVFWVYSLGMAVWALFGTAVTYHIVAIFAEAGRDSSAAFAYFFPNSLVAVSVNLLSSWLADRSRLKPFLLLMIIAFICGTWGLINLETQWGYWLMVVGFGSGGGLWGMLSNLAFVRHFGLLHLGEISGLNTSVTVFASAIGPLLFSLGKDLRRQLFGCRADMCWRACCSAGCCCAGAGSIGATRALTNAAAILLWPSIHWRNQRHAANSEFLP